LRIKERLIYTNERGESLYFYPRSQYHVNIKDVEGLSDIENEIFNNYSMGQDGNTFLGSRILERNIEIIGHIKERNKELAHRLRRRMNSVLNPQYSAVLRYELGDYVRIINCRVENAPQYTKKPIFEEFNIQLTCPSPFWRETAENRQEIALWMGGFEFPLPDGLEIPIDGTWEIGWRVPALAVNVVNGGDVRTGMRIIFIALATVENPTLTNMNTGEILKLNFTMQQHDVITINTTYGNKSVILRRGGIDIDIFNAFDTDSVFLQLDVGDNIFAYNADYGTVGNLNATIYYQNLYLGV